MHEETGQEPIDSHFQLPIPNATGVLVLGILSIPACCCLGGLGGIVMGIISLVMASKAQQLYTADPARYTVASFKNVSAGKICAIIGLSLSALTLVTTVVRVILGLASIMAIPELEKVMEEFLK